MRHPKLFNYTAFAWCTLVSSPFIGYAIRPELIADTDSPNFFKRMGLIPMIGLGPAIALTPFRSFGGNAPSYWVAMPGFAAQVRLMRPKNSIYIQYKYLQFLSKKSAKLSDYKASSFILGYDF